MGGRGLVKNARQVSSSDGRRTPPRSYAPLRFECHEYAINVLRRDVVQLLGVPPATKAVDRHIPRKRPLSLSIDSI